MRTRAAARWMICVAGLVALGACGDILHATNWDTLCDVDPNVLECDGVGSGGAGGSGGSGGGGPGEGGAGGSGATGGGPTTYSEACEAYAAAYCPRLAICRPVVYEQVGGPDQCEARLAESCAGSWSGEALGLSMSPDDLIACVEAIDFPGSNCGRVVRISAGQVLVPECRIPGTRPDGEACLDGHQCEGLRCQPGTDTPCGTCATSQDSGGPCATDAECGPGLRCAGMTCAPLLDVGAPCTSSAECFVDLYCTAAGPGGTCQPRVAETAGCDATVACAVDYYCGPSATCEAYGYAPQNQTCGSLGGQAVGCEYGSFCEIAMAGDSSGVCTAQGEPGDACPTGLTIFFGQCRYPSGCWAGMCIVPNKEECG